MKLSSVVLARYFGLVQTSEFNLNGGLYYPELVKALVEQYGFIKYPTDLTSLDESKGVEFIGGRSGKRIIEKLSILDSGIYLDTYVDTTTSQELWLELMEWAVQTLGATFKPDMVKRHVYVSQVTFESDVPILAVNPFLAKIAGVVTDEVERNYKRRLEYETAAINIHFDKESTKLGTASFSVQRRDGVPFGENKYYSSAPLKTDLHLELLQQWEQEMSA